MSPPTIASRARAAAAALLLIAAAGCAGPGERPSPRVPARVLLVGIDGASPQLVERFAAAGRLPAMQRLMADGAWGPLATIEPTVSPAIWTTLATGKLPSAHGIRGFEGVPGQSMTTLPTSQMRRVKAFWNMLSEHGRSAGVVSWWVTWPAEEVRGYIVSDRATYTRMEAAIGDERVKPHEVFPEEIADEVHALVRSPAAITDAEVQRLVALDAGQVERWVRAGEYRHGDVLTELKYVHQADRSSADVALRLMAERPTDVTAVAFYGVDAMSHLAWHWMEPEQFGDYVLDEPGRRLLAPLIENYYAYVDGLLAELIEAAGPEATVIVFSDHGFGPTGRLPWSGGHGRITPGAPVAPPGILLMAGPAVRAGARPERAHVLDLTPTLLYLEGLPVADDMPGRVLREALDETLLEAEPQRHTATYEGAEGERAVPEYVADPEADRDTIERLRKLGYIR